ncbi:structural maintenance of chromosomes 5 [Arctopsyche grandis]|uniref:structural maintenance of chromosomes 5 n=1 Tax=Arctopsyche grandis TaxID=121162 RepID=UPI00406D78BA
MSDRYACRGAIRRIALENFVTYKKVELYPGPHLNIIIGPNGTGKSTFICAIVLGLCGKTSVIGRAKKIGEFVKSGCEDAVIEIELYCGGSNKSVTINRHFNLENVSVWSIDRKTVKEKQVQELVASLNIRVDNLCQLLPQDRVQDFSKLNQQELLKSTLLAVSGQEAVSLLEELIESKTKSRDSHAKLNNNAKQLYEEEQKNARLETVLTSMNEVKKIKSEVDVCEKKKIWCEYERLKAEVDILTNDKKEALKLEKKYRKELEPYQRTIKTMEERNQLFSKNKSACSTAISILKNKMNSTLEISEVEAGKIHEIKSDWQTKIAQQQNRRRDIEQAKATLTKIEDDRDNLLKTCGSESRLKAEIGELLKPITKVNKALEDLRRTKADHQYDIESQISPQIKMLQNKLHNLRDAGNKRLDILKNMSDHTFKALHWLRENKNLFKHPVYEPMILELNFTEPHMAKYLENTVGVRDLTAFTFEDYSDMNLFIRKVRGELKLNMTNAVCSPSSNAVYSPPVDISQLKHLGFYTYLLNTVTGPSPILRYLCKQYGIHRIPIGDAKTYDVSQNVPSNISFFFTINHRFVIRVSSYSGRKLTSTSEIRKSRYLSHTIDQASIDSVEKNIENFTRQREKKINTMKEIDIKLSNFDENLNTYIAERQKLHESLDRMKTILSRVRMQQNKINTMENQPSFDIEVEKEKYNSDMNNCVVKLTQLQEKVFALFVDLKEEVIKTDVLNVNLRVIYTNLLEKKRQQTEHQNNLTNIELTLSTINNKLTSVLAKAKEKLRMAKHITGEFLPHQKGFPFMKEFSELPSELDELQEHITTLQARINCMDGGDDNVVEEYKRRKEVIKKLRQEIDEIAKLDQNDALRIQSLRNKWLPPLEKQIEDINQKFSGMFAQLGCAGEVKLSKTGAEDDYDLYGISILVRFREDAELQQLTRTTQSGGERALATALYLMALQQLSQAPFRCVDEINQGMDPINERKMFQLLVKITTECDASSQYFLLTPKLLKNLEYTKSIKVHTIMNGPQAVKYSKWNFKRFIRNGLKN